MKMMSNKNGMIVVVVLAALLVLIQTSTITAARPVLLPAALPTVQVAAATSDVARPVLASANTHNKVQVADTNNVVNVAQHVPASVSSKSALLPKDCGFRPPPTSGPVLLPPPYSTVPVAAATNDVARSVTASANADKVQVAVATNDVPNVARHVPVSVSSQDSILPQALDVVVGGP